MKTHTLITPFLTLAVLLLALCGCSEQEAPGSAAPTVVVGNAEVTGRSTATINGTISMPDGSAVTACGFLCSTVSVFPEESTTVVELTPPTETQLFQASLTGLEPDTRYYFCLYATNGYNTVRSSTGTFTTLADDVPAFAALTSIQVSQTTISLRGSLADDGGHEVQTLGVCYLQPAEGDPVLPSITAEGGSHSQTVDPSQADDFTATLTDLEPNTLYRIRAYAVTQTGTGYSQALDVITLGASVPVLSAITPGQGTATSIQVQAKLLSEGSAAVERLGFCWSTESPTPTPEGNPHTACTLDEATQTFQATLDDLEPATRYYVRAYAVNAEGTGYGETLVVTTLGEASVETLEAENITATTVTLNGRLWGDISVSECGFFLGTTEAGLHIDGQKFSISTESEALAFSYDVEELTPETTYYWCAYIVADGETLYGETKSFDTLPEGAPEVRIEITGFASLTSSSVEVQAMIESGAEELNITERGFCYAPEAGLPVDGAPTVDHQRTPSTDVGDSFAATLTGLQSRTSYVVRAYLITEDAQVYYSPVGYFTTNMSEIPDEGDIDNPGIDLPDAPDDPGTDTPGDDDPESPEIRP